MNKKANPACKGWFNRASSMPRVIAAVAALMLGGASLTACANDAAVVNDNITKDAENFKVPRRIVFLNGITDQYLLTVEGYCNIHDENGQLEVICKTGEDQYKKSFLGLSDNVTYFAEQTSSIESSASQYKVTFKPSTIIPDVEAR